jgi:YaiO family outer membrane protein
MKEARFLVGVALCLLGVCSVAQPAAAQDGYYVEAAGDYSPVKIGTFEETWKNARLSTGFFEDGRAGWAASVERQQRNQLVDWNVSARGFRRNRDWTFVGGIGVGTDPTFTYRRSFEGELGHKVVGTLVAQGGYRLLTFTSTNVHLIQPGATLYLPHGDIGARYFIVRNDARGTTTGTLLVQGTATVHRRVRLGGGGAVGQRIFDIAALSVPNAASWVGFGYAHFIMNPAWSLDAGFGRAHEDPVFSQATLTVGIRRTFGGRR